MVAVVNLKHEPDAVANGAVLIDRRTRWGNPFVVGRDGTRAQVIARYRADLWRRIRAGEVPDVDPKFREIIYRAYPSDPGLTTCSASIGAEYRPSSLPDSTRNLLPQVQKLPHIARHGPRTVPGT